MAKRHHLHCPSLAPGRHDLSIMELLGQARAWSQCNALGQWSPAFLAPGTYFMEDSFSMDPVVEWFQDDSSALQLLCILLLLHCDI